MAQALTQLWLFELFSLVLLVFLSLASLSSRSFSRSHLLPSRSLVLYLVSLSFLGDTRSFGMGALRARTVIARSRLWYLLLLP